MNRIARIVAIAAVIFLTSSIGLAEPKPRATIQRMADDALTGALRTKDDDKRQQRIARARDRMQELVSEDPNQIVSADIVFTTGRFIDELVELQAPKDIEIASLQLKTPLDDVGGIQTIQIGSDPLLRAEGGFEHRAKTTLGYLRTDMMTMFSNLQGSEGEKRRRVAQSEMLVYKVQIFGPARYLQSLTHRPDIALVAPHGHSRVITSYRSNAQMYLELQEVEAEKLRAEGSQ